MRNTIYYDSATGKPLRKMEDRPRNMALFEDTHADARILCSMDSVDLFPRIQPENKVRQAILLPSQETCRVIDFIPLKVIADATHN